MSVQETQTRLNALNLQLKGMATYNQIVFLLSAEMQHGKPGDVKMYLERLDLGAKPLTEHGFQLLIDFIKNHKSN